MIKRTLTREVACTYRLSCSVPGLNLLWLNNRDYLNFAFQTTKMSPLVKYTFGLAVLATLSQYLFGTIHLYKYIQYLMEEDNISTHICVRNNCAGQMVECFKDHNCMRTLGNKKIKQSLGRFFFNNNGIIWCIELETQKLFLYLVDEWLEWIII